MAGARAPETANRTAAGWSGLRERAARACAERGTQLTELREAVLRELWAAGVPLGAYELADRLTGRAGGHLAANSAYRLLMLFQEMGLVRRVESKHAYVVAGAESADLFLLCDGCGAVMGVSDGEVAALLAARSQALGFHATRQIVEVTGRCQDCDERGGGHG
jgi:Fur family transcriptional regulator, zinc uptake regulator